ncbi:MAG TPA: DUF6531 domain-containing protein [Verrucomicrobiae bacterium]|nr:DUF6531 domain-containing protein [Verrucomicrobiae bacterium]
MYEGELMYLAGMSYYEKCDEFDQFNQRIQGVDQIASFAAGLSKIIPASDGTGTTSTDPVLPCVDMFTFQYAAVGNDTIQPGSGQNYTQTIENFDWLLIANDSAEEHQVINRFYQQTNAVSTVRLLQLAQNGSPGIVALNRYNYVSEGTTNFQGLQLQNWDSGIWQTIVSAFQDSSSAGYVSAYITPGPMTNALYRGMAALILSPYSYDALISPHSLNGGFGSQDFPSGTISAVNTPNYNVINNNDDYEATLTAPTTSTKTVAPDVSSLFNVPLTASQMSSGDYTFDTTEFSEDQSSAYLFGLPQGTSASAQSLDFETGAQSGNNGNPSFLSTLFGSIADPVFPVTGEYHIDETDLQLPGPIPLALRRNYSSQNLANNQFGYGWKLSIMPYLALSTKATNIYAADMDGNVLAYVHSTNSASTNMWYPTLAANPQLNNNSSEGVGSLANRLRDYIQRSVSGSITNYTLYGADGSVRIFQFMKFESGTITNDRPYLTQWTDSRGNYYTFSYDTNSADADYSQMVRVKCSNGNYFNFDYDIYGHMVDAYTGDGRWIYYDYDEYGDMTTVTLPDNTTRSYEYLHSLQSVTNGSVVTQVPYSTHLIIEEDKPDGRELINAYDSNRRVTNQWSTAGSDLNPILTASFIYSNNFNITNSYTNAITGYTYVIDGNGNTNRYDYTNSLITKITDPLNQTVQQIWYPDNATSPGYPRSVEERIDKRGLATLYSYDTNGNVTTTITEGDLTGDGILTQTSTNMTIYNTNSLPVQATDAAGNSIVTVYDPVFIFLPSQVIDFAGATPVSTNYLIYGNATNVVQDGSIMQTNLAFGLNTRTIRAYGTSDAATNDTFYNGQGFATETIEYTGTGDPNITNYLFYNERGLVVDSTDAVGAVTFYDYDPMNRPIEKENIDEFGNVISLVTTYYNENGETNWTDGPQYNPDNYNYFDYDGMGRLTTKIHWRSEANSSGTGLDQPSGYNLYAQTFYQYDPLGNMLLMVDPRGAMVTNQYDTLCRLTESTHLDTDGATVLSVDGYSYEPGGEVQSHTNALGGVTTTYYTMMGSPKYQINADGSTNGWRYYLDGRINKQIQGNGAYWQTTYNDASRSTTRVFYSPSGVPEATNTVLVDRRGNTIQKVDAGFNVFNSTYDGLNRIKTTAGPATTNISETGMSPGSFIYITNVTQHTMGYFYDAAGRFVTSSNALGQLAVNQFDAIGRPLSTKNYNSTGTLVRQSYTSYSSDNNSVTVTNGLGADAVVKTAWVDTDRHTVLSIAYPSLGTTEFSENQYDLAGNLVLTEHNSSSGGLVTTWTSSSSTYDGLNRVTSTTDRDSAVTYYAYDPLNDLTNRTIPGGSQWQAVYSGAGQMQQEQDVASGNAVRITTYNYYASGSPYAGLLHTRTDGRGTACTYLYDDHLRTTNMTCTGTLPEQNLTTTWQYEPRGYLNGMTEQFANTNTGPNTSIQRSYDAYGELSGESVSDGSFGYGASQSWDVTGRRSGLTLGNNGYGFGYQGDGNMISAGNGYIAAYSYNTAGILTNRAVGNRDMGITSLDGEGRPLTVGTTINGESLTETLSYSGDGLMQSDTLNRPDFTDSRSYAYASLSRRLTSEQLNLSNSATWTNTFAYDNGTPAGPGALTQMGQANGSSGLWDGGADAFSRISLETNNTFVYPAYGHVNGQASLSAYLDSVPISIAALGTNAMQWQANMELSPGNHQLTVAALHPSGRFTAWATNYFTNSLAFQQTVDSYDANGDITNRVWENPSGTVERTQTLFWDARGRLHAITQRDASNSGYNWSAVYDPLNRRISTTTILVTNGVVYPASVQTINSYFDPMVEFLELGVSYGTKSEWKLYGPDLNGQYGGMNGVGGLDGVSPGLSLFNPTASDVHGNILAYYDSSIGSVTWNASRPTGYGAVPNYRPVALADGATIAQSSAWRGHWVDITGYYNIGVRPYDPISGRWLTYDSIWNARDPNYYTFCGGDPINAFDPDGRFADTYYNFYMAGGAGTLALNSASTSLNSFADSTQNPWVAIPAQMGSQFLSEIASANTPNTYVNGLSSFGNNISSYNQSDGIWAAGSYALTSWNVGAIYSGAANYDLTYNNAGGQVGDIYQRGTTFFSGVASTAGIATGGLSLYSLATAPANAAPIAADQAAISSVDTSSSVDVGSAGSSNPNVLSGHGGLIVDDSSPITTVPQGTSITFWTSHGNVISDALGNAVEQGVPVTLEQFPEAEGAVSYLPGASVPDYTLFPPEGLNIVGNPTTVSTPTSLSTLLKPNMGNVNWAACRSVVPVK